MTVPAPLDPIYQVIYAVVDGMSPSQALAILRMKGYSHNPDALGDAVSALQHRDEFLGRLGNPWTYLDIEPDGSRPGVSVWDAAVERAEDDLTFSLGQLAKRPAALAAVTG